MGYHKTYEDYRMDLLRIVRENGYDYEVIGYSVNHRPIYAIYIKYVRGGKYFAITSGIHGNEHPPPEMNLMFLRDLADPDRFRIDVLRELAHKCNYMIVPVVNPDGFTVWSRVNANCVDLNRNWPVGYCGYGSVPGSCCLICKGDHTLDQPETYTVYYRFFRPHVREIAAHLDEHSGTEVLAYPWACFLKKPRDEPTFLEICRLQEEIAERNHVKPYPYGWIPLKKVDIPPGYEDYSKYVLPNGLVIYRCCGVMNDTVYGQFHIISMVLETTCPFNPSYSDLVNYYYPRLQAVYAAFVRYIVEKYPPRRPIIPHIRAGSTWEKIGIGLTLFGLVATPLIVMELRERRHARL